MPSGANRHRTQIDQFFADRVMTAGVIVRGIFFSGDHLFGMEQLLVRAGTDFI